MNVCVRVCLRVCIYEDRKGRNEADVAQSAFKESIYFKLETEIRVVEYCQKTKMARKIGWLRKYLFSF